MPYRDNGPLGPKHVVGLQSLRLWDHPPLWMGQFGQRIVCVTKSCKLKASIKKHDVMESTVKKKLLLLVLWGLS